MVVFDCSPFSLVCENMTPSTKPEVHDLSYCRQRRSKSRSQIA